MKKVLVLSLAVLAFTLVFTAPTLARNGPHVGGAVAGSINGGYPQDTDACAGCHRAHTGTNSPILKTGTTMYSFCTSCHNGTGANNNVVQGRFEGIDVTYDGHNSKNDGANPVNGVFYGLNGGGFEKAAKYTGRSNRNTDFADTTSTHTVEGLNGASGLGTVWGGGETGVNSNDGNNTNDDGSYSPLAGDAVVDGGAKLTLKCTSCHNPHGTINTDATERYRILNNKVERYNGDIDPITKKGNTPAGGVVQSWEADWVKNPNPDVQIKNYTKIQYKTGIVSFCVACHTQYDKTGTVYNANDGKGYVTRYRHPMNVSLTRGVTGNGKTIAQNLNEATHIQLPVEQPTAYNDQISNDDDKLVCLTCHQVHGTSATVSPASNVSVAGDSTLLRINNRGVCQDCHQR